MSVIVKLEKCNEGETKPTICGTEVYLTSRCRRPVQMLPKLSPSGRVITRKIKTMITYGPCYTPRIFEYFFGVEVMVEMAIGQKTGADAVVAENGIEI